MYLKYLIFCFLLASIRVNIANIMQKLASIEYLALIINIFVFPDFSSMDRSHEKTLLEQKQR